MFPWTITAIIHIILFNNIDDTTQNQLHVNTMTIYDPNHYDTGC